MGNVFIGVHKPLAIRYRDKYGLSSFVETGTLRGESALWAATMFAEVLTIEIDHSLFESNKERFFGHKNIRAYFGDSRIVFPLMLDNCHGPALFWLDAHANNDTEVEKSHGRCSVMSEIEAINERYEITPHVVLVDDARLFSGENGWPALVDVMIELSKNGRAVHVEDDVVVGVKS